MNSALYFGTIAHRRQTPVVNAFHYRAFLVYLDLGELDEVFRGRWLWSARRFAPAWFRRADHVGDPTRPLDDCVRELVYERAGFRPAGPVRLLTNLRYWGYCMNPVSFYYCFDELGDRLQAIVAEIHNTPWGERHCHVLDCRAESAELGPRVFEFAKEFHVSPFMPMEIEYAWRFSAPGHALTVHMESRSKGRGFFDASMSFERRPISTGSLATALLRHPFMTGKVIVAIYWQALRLWLKRSPYYPHPGGLRSGVRP
ncbi:MAG: DUF1365 domain-containing protein [Candidatus Eisenbacteria bacterium]|uniref:DUF1365 domain-containing protein n=1 Tax=Eiseniibacteriota bacterium TaxID=2212470 RepID=A0A849SE69_UNCEI|nr:DUF1365 domain-containing protein [Candidatus Eisenbacteria bacterium]